MLLVGLLLKGITCRGHNSFVILAVLAATLFGIVGHVGHVVCLAGLT